MSVLNTLVVASTSTVASFDFAGAITQFGPVILKEGLIFTLKLTVLATIFAVIWGTVLALMRLSNNVFLRSFAGTYVNIMRSLPLIMILFWFFFLVPAIIGVVIQYWEIYVNGNANAAWSSYPLNGFMVALISFTLFEAAYFCEIIRAGIQSVSKGQGAAGYALGLRYHQVMGKIVLPQAFRNMMPVLFTQVIVLFQDTSLVTVLSLRDLLGMAKINADNSGYQVELLLFAAAIYFIVSLICSRLVKYLDRRMAIIR